VNSAAGLLDTQASFVHWGVIQISVANLIVIVLMLIIFALALLLPFPHADGTDDPRETPDGRR